MGDSKGLLQMVDYANRFLKDPTCSHIRKNCFPFYVCEKQVGFIRKDFWNYLSKYPEVFQLSGEKVVLSSELKTFEERTARIADIMEDLRKHKDLVSLQGWRDECFDVKDKFSGPAQFKMERAAISMLGMKQYGVHVNGFLRHPKRGLCMWIAKRSKTKPTFPGKLDQMVAGGFSSGLGILECVHKECMEEASVPEELRKNIVPAGTVSYFYEDERGIFPETEFVFDLEVPESFTPVNADGEAESFQLLEIEEVKKLITTDAFKFNCAVVILDFLIRHGLIEPDTEPNYVYLCQSIHQTLF